VPQRPLTRRSLVARGLAGGGGLLLPASRAGRALAGSDPEIFSMALADPARPARAPKRFDLIGVEWKGPSAPEIQIRVRRGRGDWSPWLAAPVHPGHAPDAGRPKLVTDPVWAGASDIFQIRSSSPLGNVRMHFVDSGSAGIRGLAARTRFVSSGLAGQPPIIARSTWADGRTRPRKAPYYGEVKVAVVHHTVNGNGYSKRQSAAIVRGMALFHRNVNGWNDLGYNFVVDRFGQIFEGRGGGIDEALTGAHAGGYNFATTGVAVLGSFSASAPSARAFESLARLLAWKLSLHGVPAIGRDTIEVSRPGSGYSRYPAGAHVSLKRISGHRDADVTSCPGGGLYARLPRLRRIVASLQGTLSSLTAAPAARVVEHPNPVSVAGTLSAGGEAIAGVPVELQQRRASGQSTIAATTTAADGSWSASAPIESYATLRAVFRGAEGRTAVVTPTFDVAVRPQVTLSAAAPATIPGGTIEFTGGTSPAKPRAEIVVAKQGLDGAFAEIRRIAVVTDAGGFRRTIGFADPGRYQLTAETAADGLHAAGRSAPVEVVVA
jgi:hypothetical protein